MMSHEEDETETWADSDGAKSFLADLKMKRSIQLDALLGSAKVSNDPIVRANSYAVEQLDMVINNMEDERAKSHK